MRLRHQRPVRLAAAAEADYRAILAWTAEQFGPAQMRIYAQTLMLALDELGAWPGIPGARPATGLPIGFFILHVGRRRRRGRHIIVFRVRRDGSDDSIEVVRILHDVMDVTRHVPSI